MKFLNFTLILLLLAGFYSKGIAQAESNGFVIGKTEKLASKVLGEDRTLYIHVPKGKPDKKYPVLYLLDGGGFFPMAFSILRMDAELLPKMIIVGISNKAHRTRDLTPVKSKNLPGSGGGEKFTGFIEKELIPYIDKKYPTQPYRTLVGFSLGGWLTVNTLVHHTHLFDNYIAIDPSLRRDKALLQAAIKKVKTSGKFAKKRFFMAVANTMQGVTKGLDTSNVMQDKTRFTRHIRAGLQLAKTVASQNKSKLGFDWKYFPNANHANIPYPAIYEGLCTVFDWFKMDAEELATINDPKTDLEIVLNLFDKHYVKLSKKFGYKVLPNEGYVNSLGYMYLQTRQPKRSEAFFKRNIKYYPKSANVYDSMADYYIAKKDNAQALKYLTKAYEISRSKYHKNRINKLKTKM